MTTTTTRPQPEGPAGPIAPPAKPAAGTIQRQEFGAAELQTQAETATAALAAREQALVQARFVMALRKPRDWDDVRAKLLKACERPGFAGSATEKVFGAAWYKKPVGDGVEGFSVRFAEEALRCMGNLDVLPTTIYEDDRKRILSVQVLDLENNTSVTTTVTVEKTIERRQLRKGEEAIRMRPNSYGGVTYVVEATEEEVFGKQQSAVSKALRNGVLRILPGDIQAECRTRILEIRNGDIAKDPDAARRKIVDGFAALNVFPPALKDYLGHDIGTCTPAELAELRELWEAIRDGKTTWNAVIEDLRTERGDDRPPGEDKPKTGLDGAAERAAAKAAAAGAGAAASTAPGCAHAKVLPSMLAGGKKVACPDCGEELSEPREPGADDDVDDPPAALGGKPPRGRLKD